MDYNNDEGKKQLLEYLYINESEGKYNKNYS